MDLWHCQDDSGLDITSQSAFLSEVNPANLVVETRSYRPRLRGSVRVFYDFRNEDVSAKGLIDRICLKQTCSLQYPYSFQA